MTETAQTFARRLREVRARQGFTQDDLATRVKGLDVPMERTAVARIESGDRKVSIEEAVAFAAALDVPLLSLLLGKHLEGFPAPTSLAWLSGTTPLAREGVEGYKEAVDELRAWERAFETGLHPRAGRVPEEMLRAFIELEKADIEDLARHATGRPAIADEIRYRQERLEAMEGWLK